MIGNAETQTAVFNVNSGATEDQWGNIIPSESIYTTTQAVFSHLTSSEQIARQQLQDNSKYKLYVDNTAVNKLITNEMTVSIESDKFRINGTPKISPLGHGWITIYIESDKFRINGTPKISPLGHGWITIYISEV